MTNSIDPAVFGAVTRPELEAPMELNPAMATMAELSQYCEPPCSNALTRIHSTETAPDVAHRNLPRNISAATRHQHRRLTCGLYPPLGQPGPCTPHRSKGKQGLSTVIVWESQAVESSTRRGKYMTQYYGSTMAVTRVVLG